MLERVDHRNRYLFCCCQPRRSQPDRKAAEAQDAAAHGVQAADAEERQRRVHVAGWTHGCAERCQVRQQDDALLIQRPLESKMRDFKQGHRTCPKGDEAGVRNVRPNEGARRVDEPSVPGPPSKPC
jgi:hypothetical protein